MNKKPSLIITCVIMMVAIFGMFAVIFFVVNGIEHYDPQPDYGYKAERLAVTAIVNTDYTVDITESYTIYYAEESRGFFRSLPTNSGERYSDIKVDGAPVKPSTSTIGMLTLRIGSEDYWLYRQSKDYEISYTVKIPSKDKDALLYNFIGTDYDMVLENVSLSVIFQKPPESEPEIHAGVNGAVGTIEGLTSEYDAESGTLIVTADRLEPFNGITVGARFVAGTMKEKTDVVTLVMWIVAVAAAAAAIVLYIFFGRQTPPVAVVNFYPPAVDGDRELTPAEAGLLIDDKCSNEDVTGMIFYWASKGYLEIEDTDGDMQLIYKSAPPDNAPRFEKELFSKLFAGAQKRQSEDGEYGVALSSLSERFYDKITAAKHEVSSMYSGKLYSASAKTASTAMSIAGAALAFLAVFVCYLRAADGWFNFYGLAALLPALSLSAMGTLMQKYWFKLSKKQRGMFLVGYVMYAVTLYAVLLILLPSCIVTGLEKAAIGIGASVIMLIAPFMNRRTKFYNESLGQLIGFRDFLRLAEKDKLEALLEQDPQYYYNILPYANVLGVSEIWQNKFEGLTLEPPRYYRMSVGDIFMIAHFNRMYNRMHTRVYNSMTSVPSSDFGGGSHSGGGFGGGGHSGGGSVGGGFGGGGSRRW